MADLTEAQRLMVEDGLPADLILPPEQRAASWKGKRLRSTNTFAEPKRPTKDEDPATKALRKELAAAEEAKKAARFARLNQLKQETTMSKTPKKAATTKKAAKKTPRKAAPKADKAAHSASGATKGIRPGSKLETIVGLLRRPQGCTTADVLKATEWPAVSMPQQAKAAGLTLRKEKKDGVTVYYADAA